MSTTTHSKHTLIAKRDNLLKIIYIVGDREIAHLQKSSTLALNISRHILMHQKIMWWAFLKLQPSQ